MRDTVIPELVSGWWEGPVLDTVGYRFWRGPKICIGLLIGKAKAQLVPG